MAKYFAKLSSEIDNILLRDGSTTIQGYKVEDLKLAQDLDTPESIKAFHNNDAEYEEYFEGENNNPKGKPAFIEGYYIPSLNKFTNRNSFPSWKLDLTDLIYGPPEPWPLIDISMTENDQYVIIWDEDNLRLTRAKLNEDFSVIEPKQIQVYNTSTTTWEDL
jgi:hypothetical protein